MVAKNSPIWLLLLLGLEYPTIYAFDQPEIEESDLSALSEKKVLSVGLYSENASPIVEVLKEYSKSHPDIEFQFDTFPIYKDLRQNLYEHFHDILMIDDPWIPQFSEILLDLRPILKKSHLIKSLETQFLPGLLEVSHIGSGLDQRWIGIPLIGNVQLMIFKEELLRPYLENQQGTFEPQQWVALDLSHFLTFANCLKEEGISEPLAIKDADETGVAQVFWELLRANGYEDQVQSDGAVIVSRETLEKAYSDFFWIQKVINKNKKIRPKLHHDNSQLIRILFDESYPTDLAMTFGWPSWVFQGHRLFPTSQLKLGVYPISPHPVMGIWLLGVHKNTLYPGLAAELVAELTLNRSIQIQMAGNGSMPVLQSISADDLDGAFWKRYYSVIQKGLVQSRPRPRTTKWPLVEQILFDAVRKGKNFKTVPGVFIVLEE